jgi:SAM-dependent methyltransferase
MTATLLQYVCERGIGCYGVEPTAGTAAAAAPGDRHRRGLLRIALAEKLVAEGRQADLMAANNVLAHVPDINDFVGGFARLLKPEGVATFEFPHLLRMVAENQFDTAYHEHYSYLSLTAVARIFDANGLAVFDVEALPTHGGSLRVFAGRTDGPWTAETRVAEMLAREEEAGVRTAAYYAGFQAAAEKVKDDLLAFLVDARRQGLKVGAYGAAAKGNTLLNFAGVRPDLLPYVVDRNPPRRAPGCRAAGFRSSARTCFATIAPTGS